MKLLLKAALAAGLAVSATAATAQVKIGALYPFSGGLALLGDESFRGLELAGAYSGFYAADKVIVDDPAVRARRLLLCHRTLITLETGLHLLGLRTLERM